MSNNKLSLLIPIIAGIMFAGPLGDTVLRLLGIATTGIPSFIATVAAGCVLGLVGAFVWIRLTRKRPAEPLEIK